MLHGGDPGRPGIGGGDCRAALFTYMENDQPTILLVEDDRTTRRFLADNLTADGFELLEAGSVAGPGDRLAAHRFPICLLLDLGLPDGDGLAWCVEIRGESRAAGRIDPDLPVLVAVRTGTRARPPARL